jgi:hypothetical protein
VLLHAETPFTPASHVLRHRLCALIPPPLDHCHTLHLFVLVARYSCILTCRFDILGQSLVVQPFCVYKITRFGVLNNRFSLSLLSRKHSLRCKSVISCLASPHLLVHVWLIHYRIGRRLLVLIPPHHTRACLTFSHTWLLSLLQHL